MKGRVIIVLILCIALLAAAGPTAYAGAQKKTVVQDLVQNPDTNTLVIRVTWETGQVQTTLIAPSGKRIPLAEGTPDTKVTFNGNSLEAYIYNPEIGQWKIEFVGGGNGKVRAETTKIIEALKITNIQASQIPGTNDVSLSFSSQGDRQTREFHYDIYLIADEKEMNGKLMGSGTGTVGNTESLTLSLNEVNSFTRYFLRINATAAANGVYDFDSAVSPSFAFSHKNDIPKVDGLLSTLNLNDRTLVLSWNKKTDGIDADGYRVSIFRNDEIIPFMSEDVALDNLSYTAQFTEDAQKLKARVSLVRGGIAGEPAEVEIALSSLKEEPVAFTLPEGLITNRSDFLLPYKVNRPAMLTVRVNDRESRHELKKDGILNLKLDHEHNAVALIVTVSDGIRLAKEFELILDNVPPQLMIYEDIDGMRCADDRVVLLGNVEQSAVLTVNNAPAAFDDKGNFVFEGRLKPGKNSFIVHAKDGAGNISEYKAVVYRVIDLNGTYWLLIGGLAGCVAVFILYWRKGLKKA